MADKASIITLQKKDSFHVVSAGVLYRLIAEGAKTDQRFSVMETILEPSQGAPFHVHTREDEAFFVLEGEVTFYFSDRQFLANKEDFVSCPPGTKRGLRNNTAKTARMLLIYSSAGVEEMTVRDGKSVPNGAKASDLNSDRNFQCPTLSEDYGITEFDEKLPDNPEVNRT